MKFRPQRGGLAEAMREVVELDNLEQLKHHIRNMYHLGCGSKLGVVKVEKYGSGIDERIGWDTHLVTLDGSPVGFTDGPCG